MAEMGLVNGMELPLTLFADMGGSLVTSEAVLKAVLQHSPSLLKPLLQVLAVPTSPLALRGVQVPVEQYSVGLHIASLEQGPGQPTPTPSQLFGAQAGTPGLPRALTEQVPTEEGRSQASQALRQSVLQQRPSAQNDEAHAVARAQSSPLASRTPASDGGGGTLPASAGLPSGVQSADTQRKPTVQSASD